MYLNLNNFGRTLGQTASRQLRHFPRENRSFAVLISRKRVKKALKSKVRRELLKKKPIDPSIVPSAYPSREDKDPDPFGVKSADGEVHPVYHFKDFPLHPGIRPEQLRFHFTSDDIIACGVEPGSKREELITQALSMPNASQREIRNQLVQNEIARWGFSKYDTGSPEVQISIFTLRLRNIALMCKDHPNDKIGKYNYNLLYWKRKRMMLYLRKIDFGRYKKILTYLGLRDTLSECGMGRGKAQHPMEHALSAKKPPGGRLGHTVKPQY